MPHETREHIFRRGVIADTSWTVTDGPDGPRGTILLPDTHPWCAADATLPDRYAGRVSFTDQPAGSVLATLHPRNDAEDARDVRNDLISMAVAAHAELAGEVSR